LLHEFRSTETFSIKNVTPCQTRFRTKTDYIASVQTWLETEDTPGEKLASYIFLSLVGIFIIGAVIRYLIGLLL
jgi:hypothetical protein